MSNDNEFEDVRIGFEIGEHNNKYDHIIQDIKKYYDISKINFVLLYFTKSEVPENTWYDWAEFFKENKIYFAFLYTQQRGAPDGEVSHLTSDKVKRIKEIAGEYFIGDMIGETGGLVSWWEGYYKDVGIEKPRFNSLYEAKNNYINEVKKVVDIDRELGVPAVLDVEATMMHRYNFEAGCDYSFVEMLCGNPEVLFASVRGASKAYHKNWWGSHIATEWYGGFRNDDPLKYKRIRLAYYFSFISGAKYIYPESGNFSVDSYGYKYDIDSQFCKKYREIWNEFSDFVHLHKRPVNGPKIKIGILQGNLDSRTGWGDSTVWNNFSSKDWAYSDAEYGWDHVENINSSEKWYNPNNYGENDVSCTIPYGMYDIVPIESELDVLESYDCLIAPGWNTMTAEYYDKLKKYVENGGKLFMSVPQLCTNDTRGENYKLINDGDFSDLFGVIVKGKGGEINGGTKFINESIIPLLKYPVTKDGNCDPICSNGVVEYSDVELKGASPVAILADKFVRWSDNSPVILTENKFGKGYATLLTSWSYPGNISLDKLVHTIYRTILNGENAASDIMVLCSDKINYAVYQLSNGDYILYLLNTDYNVSNNAVIKYNKMDIEVEIKSCEIRSVYINQKIMFSVNSTKFAIQSVDNEDKSFIICLKGKGGSYINIVSNTDINSAAVNGVQSPVHKRDNAYIKYIENYTNSEDSTVELYYD